MTVLPGFSGGNRAFPGSPPRADFGDQKFAGDTPVALDRLRLGRGEGGGVQPSSADAAL